ncbi:hypothetical protein QBC38DRAFT_200897 [Podospora fimiseda]|uniref:Rhodanese domain-containing protein n=1 Tax=Podospora fimiseda TaxID=252190 RepID=A0AAN7BXU4_9PEZI|nr:hypothetical protein QBC38DRAFT_200897 [Podospora fimiseda]
MPIAIPHTCTKKALRQDGTPWYSDFPEPESTPSKTPSSEIYTLLSSSSLLAKNILLIDTRRTDCTGGTIQGSINIPAHSFYWSRKVIYDLCLRGGVKRVVFYCGSSNGRGPRCAAWMQDYIDSVGGDVELKAEVMVGGIRSWVKAYGGEMMEGYDEKVWEAVKQDEV